ncbi:MAG: hypothetical protein Q8Q20_04775 [bacterium]|nr:hypothetical protein [bacterium]
MKNLFALIALLTLVCGPAFAQISLDDPEEKAPPTGACCVEDGTCKVTTNADCAGAWTDGGVCDPNPCPQPKKAEEKEKVEAPDEPKAEHPAKEEPKPSTPPKLKSSESARSASVNKERESAAPPQRSSVEAKPTQAAPPSTSDGEFVVKTPNFRIRWTGSEYEVTVNVSFPQGVHWDDGAGTAPFTVWLSGYECRGGGDPVFEDVDANASSVTFTVGPCDKESTLYLRCLGANGKTGWPWSYGGFNVVLPPDGQARIWKK